MIDCVFGIWLNEIPFHTDARNRLEDLLEKLIDSCEIPKEKRRETEAFWGGFLMAERLYLGKI